MASAPPTGQTDSKTGERYLILGTAGHIDHGKTALVEALTGTNTDRLPEEKSRGMTIELGFAELAIGPVHFGVVDVPGHERFVRTMVSGATAVDVALLVVAADDSVMPQTVEHVEILSLLGVEHGVVAVTKTDAVDADLVGLVTEEVRELLRDTSLRDAPIIPVSSVARTGIDALRQALADVAGRVRVRVSDSPFRMAVDRVFTIQGRGTVVTGSVLRGRVAVGATLQLWPSGESCKVRSLQSHGRPADEVCRGQRAALNLIGVDRAAVERGSELATPGYLETARVLDAKLHCLASCRKSIRSLSRARLCTGTRETLVRVVPLSGNHIKPGETTYVQFRSSEPLIATYKQQFIVRDEVASRTIAGGVVLRCPARRWTADRDSVRASLDVLDSGDDAARVDEVLRFAGFEPVTDLRVCAAAGVEIDHLPEVYDQLDAGNRRIRPDQSQRRVSAAAVEDLSARAVRRLERFHQANPDEPGYPADPFLGWLDRKSAKGLGRALFDRLAGDGRVKTIGQYVCLPAFAPAMSAQDERVLGEMIDEYYAAAFQPPKLGELRIARQATPQRLQRLVKIAESTGQLVRVHDDFLLDGRREQELRDIVRGLMVGGRGVTVAQIRERLNSSRKYVVPFVEYLDRIHFTRRDGDLRVLNESDTP